jgi:hypothetical protein
MQNRKLKGNPMFSARTLMYQVFSMAMNGTQISAIEKVCRKKGSTGFSRLLRILRSGKHYGRTWSINERDGFIKVTPNQEVIPRQKRKKKNQI